MYLDLNESCKTWGPFVGLNITQSIDSSKFINMTKTSNFVYLPNLGVFIIESPK